MRAETHETGYLRGIVVSALLMLLFHTAGCAKQTPPTDGTVRIQSSSDGAFETTEAAEPRSTEIIVSDYEPASISPQQSFHLKITPPATARETEVTSTSPGISLDQTPGGRIPRVVAELAEESEMYHPQRLPITKVRSCVSCHSSLIRKSFVHAPVSDGDCDVCHGNMTEDPPFGLVDTGVALCWECHDDHRTSVKNAGYLHAVIRDEGCLGCHDPHGSDTTRYFLREDELTLCLGCHRKETRKMIRHMETAGVVHKPVTEGRCSSCHASHAANYKKLTKKGPEDESLCFSCHEGMAERATSSPDRHGPVREGLCTPCHEPHAGYYARDLKYNVSEQFYNTFDFRTYSLCFKCHRETIVLDRFTTHLTNFRNGERNLHFHHVNRENGHSCLVCHEVHMGSQQHHIRTFIPFGEWEIPMAYIATPTGGSCSASCHVPREYDRYQPVEPLIEGEKMASTTGETTVGPIQAKGEKGPSNHLPYIKQQCRQCHLPAGFFNSKTEEREEAISSDSVQSFPNRLLMSINQICLKCHEYDTAEKGLSQGIWIHAPSTHGACISCHYPHASELPYLLRSQSPVLCLGQCHKEGYLMKIEEHKGNAGCLECHNPHMGKNASMLRKDYKETWRPPKVTWIETGTPNF